MSRGGKARFISIPHYVYDSASFAAITPNAERLLTALIRQYDGFNNGDLTAIKSQLRFNPSRDTLKAALTSLVEQGLIVKVGEGTTGREGGKRPYLYALTWLNIDEQRGKRRENKLGRIYQGATKEPLRTKWPQAG
ncbi:hypothetical protein [Vibrio fluvialis]|uniref:hypothetical protein n=1 Tax=Vibrio fluvialis TaxID=676 RepID=UPI003D7C8F92